MSWITRRVPVLAATSIAALALATGVATAAPSQPAAPTPTAGQNQTAGALTQISSAEFVLTPPSGVSVTASGAGAAATDGATTVALPTSTTDSTGAPVQLRYVQQADELHIQVIDPAKAVVTQTDPLAASQNIFKCILGTGGGAGGGGLAGAGVGSAIPGLGTLAGGIIGGVSGAATGAAASCF